MTELATPKEPISLLFIPINDEMTGYSIDLHIPESYHTLTEAPAFSYDIAAIHFFLRSEENMKHIMQYFDDNVEDFRMGDEQETEYDADMDSETSS